MCCTCYVFFFKDTATTEIYTLSLHDALPIYVALSSVHADVHEDTGRRLDTQFLLDGLDQSRRDRRHLLGDVGNLTLQALDRKSTRLNSSHANISYAVFCLKKKKKNTSHL